MERLTERTSSGAANLAYPAACYFNDGTRGGIATSAYRQKAINRLAAYEDTGLEPEDFKKAFNEDALLKKTTQYLGTTPDRLIELTQADKEGRLVELPCKEDDEVYVLLIGRVLPFEVTSVNLDGRGQPLFRAMHGLRLVYAFRTEDINKTVFLTREEAEAALAGEGGNT